MVPSLVCPSPFSPLPFTSGSLRCSFAFFSFVVFVFLSLFRLVPAGVAVLSTSLATTEQRARLLGFLLGRPLGGVDGRRLEVVVEGLPVFHGAQLAIDTTLVFPLRADGVPHRQCATSDGAALQAVRRRKERTCPELSGTQGRARLVVLAAEVGGRWSEETRCFISLLARAKVRSLPKISPGTSVGGPFSLVLPRELWHLRSSRTAGVLARMARRHQRRGG